MSEESESYTAMGIRMPIKGNGAARKPILYRPGYVYLVHGGGHFKIGKTRNLPSRMQYFGLHLPFPVSLFHVIPAYDYTWAEQVLHNMFSLYRVNGEWFDLDDQAMFGFMLHARQSPTGWVMAWELNEDEQAMHADEEWWSIFRSWFDGTQADD
jgi:hypothetical protein